MVQVVIDGGDKMFVAETLADAEEIAAEFRYDNVEVDIYDDDELIG